MVDISQEILGFTASDEAVILYTMKNSSGAEVKLINIGAAIVSVNVPDNKGQMRDVVLGFKMYDKYVGDGAAHGKSVGRFANRIAKGRFTLDDVEYTLATNNGPNALHGGPTGFMNRVWESRVETDRVVFNYVAAPGEEGYPSEIGVEAVYDWSEDNELEITYFASTDGATIVNLTNHVYFNLNGEGSGDIHSHTLKLNAENFLPTDETQIPTGEFAPVAGTPMDFREPKAIGAEIDADFEPLVIGHGYDHCWVIDNHKAGVMTPAAELYSPESGIKLDVATTQPGVQIYTGNWLTGCGMGKCGKEHQNRDGVAIECQNFPDAPNKPHFPSPVIRKGEVYEQHITFKFSVK
ncbi:MAG: aldose epimerase family protein [Rikenellaceae bacterium]